MIQEKQNNKTIYLYKTQNGKIFIHHDKNNLDRLLVCD